jgi:ribonuclease P protein component
LTPVLQVRKVSRSFSHRVARTVAGGARPWVFRAHLRIEGFREAHFSASQSAQKEKARLSPQNEYEERPPGIEAAAGEGPGTSLGIVPREGGAADQRLLATERIRLGHEYRRVYDEGQPHRSPLLVLFVLLSPELARKAGFVAGKRVGGAVERNRSKRLMREAYRRNKNALLESGVHLVLVARNGCGEATYGDLESQLLGLFERAGLMRAESRKDTQ